MNRDVRSVARRIVALEAELDAARRAVETHRNAASRVAASPAARDSAGQLSQETIERVQRLHAEIAKLSQETSEVAIAQARRRRDSSQRRRNLDQPAKHIARPDRSGGSLSSSRQPAIQRLTNDREQRCERCARPDARQARRAWLCRICRKIGWGRCTRCDRMVHRPVRARCADCAQELVQSVRTVSGGLFEGHRRRH